MANMASACAFVVSNESSFNPVRSWSTKTAATTCIIVSVAVVSICVMAVCGVFIVREYSLSASYKKTKCWVSNITYTEIRSCTYCTQKHKTVSTCSPSNFPCVRIKVAYEMDGGIREGLLHSDSIEAAGLFSHCSHHVCVGDFATNQGAIHLYVEKWKKLMLSHIQHNMRYQANNKRFKTLGDRHETKLEAIINKYFTLTLPELTTTSAFPENESENKNENSSDLNTKKYNDDNEKNGRIKSELLSKETLSGMNSTTLMLPAVHPAIMDRIKQIIENKTYARSSDRSSFTCFSNQQRPYDVIENKTYTKWDAIHSMLWPALVIAVCCFMFLYIETQRRQLTCCGRKPLEYVARKKNQKHHHHRHHHHHHHHHHHQYHRASDAEEVAMESVNKNTILEPRNDNNFHKSHSDFDNDSYNGSHNNPSSATNLYLNNNKNNNNNNDKNNNDDEIMAENCEKNNKNNRDYNSNNSYNNNLNNKNHHNNNNNNNNNHHKNNNNNNNNHHKNNNNNNNNHHKNNHKNTADKQSGSHSDYMA